jgi:hypothetical protein
MLKFLSRTLAVLVIALCFSTAHGQETKIVVIPLGGDDIDQCQVATACDAGMATLSCPSGDSVVTCTVPKRVFVTSTTHTGNLGGLDGADAICQGLANQQRLNGVFKAWLSDSNASPSTRFIRSSQPYILTDGTAIASNYEDLVDGLLSSDPIFLTETGSATGECQDGGRCFILVWTGTLFGGTPRSDTGFCAGPGGDWVSSSSMLVGGVGVANVQDSRWSSLNSQACERSHRLFCFEQ